MENTKKGTLQKKKVKKVLVGGCFDILHIGHIKFLIRAKKLGTKLVVALESDKKVTFLKGLGRPINSQNVRKEMLLSLKSVDEVINLPFMESDEDYKRMTQSVKPDIIATTQGDPFFF